MFALTGRITVREPRGQPNPTTTQDALRRYYSPFTASHRSVRLLKRTARLAWTLPLIHRSLAHRIVDTPSLSSPSPLNCSRWLQASPPRVRMRARSPPGPASRLAPGGQVGIRCVATPGRWLSDSCDLCVLRPVPFDDVVMVCLLCALRT